MSESGEKKIIIKTEGKDKEDVEELREVFDVISEFLDKAKDTIKEIIVAVAGSLNGEKLGKEVAALYKELKASGLPDDVVNEMVRDFYKKKLESAPSVGELLKTLTEGIKFKKKVELEEEEKEEEEEED
ncbi:MAG: hypothetical protein B6U89_00550 [Desulfurococcales archaeon ex4484_58]|nr:MAG: hypothetical protein B6U89_00550 [Desulfurococcales archaeon ex4484_58]